MPNFVVYVPGTRPRPATCCGAARTSDWQPSCALDQAARQPSSSFYQAHISIPSSTPNHPQPRLPIRCIHISGTGPNGACTRAHAHIPQGATRLSGNNTHPRLNAEPPAAPLVLPLCTCSGYRPASGPVPMNTKPSPCLCGDWNRRCLYPPHVLMRYTGQSPPAIVPQSKPEPASQPHPARNHPSVHPQYAICTW